MNAFERLGVGEPTEIISGRTEIIGDRAVVVPGVDNPKQYMEGKYTAQDRIDVGFQNNGATIGPGLDVTFIAAVSTPFKPEEFIIPSDIAPDLSVTAIVIGPNSYTDGGPVPAAVYSEVSVTRKVSWDTVQTSVQIKITIHNDSAAAVIGKISLRGLRLR